MTDMRGNALIVPPLHLDLLAIPCLNTPALSSALEEARAAVDREIERALTAAAAAAAAALAAAITASPASAAGASAANSEPPPSKRRS
jgi:hypothetical protein